MAIDVHEIERALNRAHDQPSYEAQLAALGLWAYEYADNVVDEIKELRAESRQWTSRLDKVLELKKAVGSE